MSHLIQLRQRIKAIEVIKKITHAMRLISMSSHTNLQHKQNDIKQYKSIAYNLTQTIFQLQPSYYNPILKPKATTHPKHLVILIGSQKGLCGNFNTMLFSFFESTIIKQENKSLQAITIGKKATTFLAANKAIPIIEHYPSYNTSNLDNISSQIVKIISSQPYFSSITVVSNMLKTFFSQVPRKTQLIPISTNKIFQNTSADYLWEQSPDIIFSYLTHEYLYSSIYYLLYESLLSEQATRFIAMDSSTRNANQLLDNMNLMYNKLRQAKITRELTELMASFK